MLLHTPSLILIQTPTLEEPLKDFTIEAFSPLRSSLGLLQAEDSQRERAGGAEGNHGPLAKWTGDV